MDGVCQFITNSHELSVHVCLNVSVDLLNGLRVVRYLVAVLECCCVCRLFHLAAVRCLCLGHRGCYIQSALTVIFYLYSHCVLRLGVCHAVYCTGLLCDRISIGLAPVIHRVCDVSEASGCCHAIRDVVLRQNDCCLIRHRRVF